MKPNYRCCVGCRKIAHKSTLWRIVRLYPSHQVRLDTGIGRSAYLCPQESCLQLAQKKGRLGRVLKATVPETIFQQLRERLVEQEQLEQPELSVDQMKTER